MKITIAQLNPVVGDIQGNLKKIEEVLKKQAKQSELFIFPELFIVGYPPKDLVERPWFIERVIRAVEQLKEFSLNYPETGILCGAPLPTADPVGKRLTNSAILVSNGKLLWNQPKSLLPTYDVFDEARHFDPAERTGVINFKGEKLGISVCEDAWNDPDLRLAGKLYHFDPIAALAQAGAGLLINISASPFHIGKAELRYRLIGNHARKHQRPFIFVNQVGGNDELVFDGGSMAFDRNGNPMALAPLFEEAVLTVDTDDQGDVGLYRPPDRIETVYRALVLGTRDYLKKCGFTKAVIGLSGGIDSALVCCLATAAVGAGNVLGVSMPSPYSSAGSVEDSRKLAANLGVDFKVIPIDGIFQSYLNELEKYFEGRSRDVTEENIQARIRGNILMAFSNKFGYLALPTGNKSELAVGYCTLYGDMSGGLSVISDLPKTMVYEVANFINRERELIPGAILEKAPSAELRPGQKDQDTLPPYPVLDRILHYYIEEGYSAEQINRAGFDPETVKWVIRAVDQSEYKRKQAAPGLKITSKAFGTGRRMPVAKQIEK